MQQVEFRGHLVEVLVFEQLAVLPREIAERADPLDLEFLLGGRVGVAGRDSVVGEFDGVGEAVEDCLAVGAFGGGLDAVMVRGATTQPAPATRRSRSRPDGVGGRLMG
ncbi:hypothetical protein [Natrinema sp. SYSU A 869]|uniref:hypothetical protein n=1 Tax=Natrinema sp. SYSU A 869 TaxID=2871694 RepID=UPI001CA397DE|nr:hypothetical protein [Natrinema sp. SYSU A 869]